MPASRSVVSGDGAERNRQQVEVGFHARLGDVAAQQNLDNGRVHQAGGQHDTALADAEFPATARSQRDVRARARAGALAALRRCAR